MPWRSSALAYAIKTDGGSAKIQRKRQSGTAKPQNMVMPERSIRWARVMSPAPEDEAEAIRWYRKTAEQGYALTRGALKELQVK